MSYQRRLYIVLWVSLSILLLWGLYFSAQSSLGGYQAGGAQSRTYPLTISVPHLGEELPVLKATQGDVVTLVISSDRSGEANVHGYEKKIDLEPGGKVTLSFTATEAGVFPLHLHEELHPGKSNSPVNHRHLATLEVQPE